MIVAEPAFLYVMVTVVPLTDTVATDVSLDEAVTAPLSEQVTVNEPDVVGYVTLPLVALNVVVPFFFAIVQLYVPVFSL